MACNYQSFIQIHCIPHRQNSIQFTQAAFQMVFTPTIVGVQPGNVFAFGLPYAGVQGSDKIVPVFQQNNSRIGIRMYNSNGFVG
jgi:hypothetical protein